MDVGGSASTAFVLVEASWTPPSGLELIKALGPSHVVVVRRDHGVDPLFYLLDVDDAEQELEGGVDASSIREALNLHETDATPVIAPEAIIEAPMDRFVVHDSGRVIAFVDRQPEATVGGDIGRMGHIGGNLRGEGPSGGRGPSAPPPDGAAGLQGGPPIVSGSIVAKFPQMVVLDETASLLVSLASLAAPEEGIPVALPEGSELTVIVQPRRGFLVEGPDELPLVVLADADALPIQFKLRGVDLGPGQIDVLAFHQGQALGRVRLIPTVIQPEEQPAPHGPAEPRSAPLAPISVRVPDLSMLIEESQVGEEHRYTVRLTAQSRQLGLNLKKFGPLPLRVDPGRFFADFFADIEGMAVTTPREIEEAQAKMASKGTWLFEKVFPEDLRRTLWGLRDSITSIMVQSEEPWIPWELCKLTGEEDGQIVEGKFLCEAYRITRWDPGTAFREPLSIDRIGLVVPADSGLPAAEEEAAYMESLGGNGRRVDRIPANPLDVRKALASGIYDCWHFTGHGAARDEDPDRATILLEGGAELTPEDLSGTVANLGKSRSPIVFLNACQVGRGGMSLTGVGGWAKRFLDAGAGAFIGSYWSVQDKPAVDFAKSVYAHIVGGAPLGQAVQEARVAIRPSGDPTWLAYTVFGDPLATLGS